MKLGRRGFIFLLLVALVVPSVAAQSLGSPDRLVGDMVEVVKGFFTPILSALFGVDSIDAPLFAKFLLAVLLFVVINAIVLKMPVFKNQRNVSIIVSLVIAIFAVRFISEEGFILGILLPYGTLGVALTAILPFLIFFYFIHDSEMSTFGRRICWFFFGIVFIFLWASRNIGSTMNYIYGFTLVGVALAFMFDESIHKYFGLREEHRARRARRDANIARIERELDGYSNMTNLREETRRHIEALEQRLRELRRS